MSRLGFVYVLLLKCGCWRLDDLPGCMLYSEIIKLIRVEFNLIVVLQCI